MLNDKLIMMIMDNIYITSLAFGPLQYALCLSYHSIHTQNGPNCSLLSGWATMTGRLLGPKMAFKRLS